MVPFAQELCSSFIFHFDCSGSTKRALFDNFPVVQGGSQIKKSLDSLMGTALSFDYDEGPRLVILNYEPDPSVWNTEEL